MVVDIFWDLMRLNFSRTFVLSVKITPVLMLDFSLSILFFVSFCSFHIFATDVDHLPQSMSSVLFFIILSESCVSAAYYVILIDSVFQGHNYFARYLVDSGTLLIAIKPNLFPKNQ